jgi:hypothetical protein
MKNEVTLEDIKKILKKEKKRFNKLSIDEQTNSNVWAAIHTRYGRDIWNKVRNEFNGDISEEKINNMVSEFLEDIRGREGDKDIEFINEFNNDNERYNRILKNEFVHVIDNLEL